ncbi:MAG: hypothetical protein MR508_10655 [Lachnospiraceae bacterium]|nr:hypothetical protein [Lachnospiraceae bacterium]
MSVNAVNAMGAQAEVYAAYDKQKTQGTSKADNNEKGTETSAEKANEEGVVYEKSDASSKNTGKATYSINKMSEEDRAALVKQLQADQESRKQQLVSIVQKMMGQQAATYANANDLWKFLAKGDYTVDAQTKLQAQQDISEDGYYGVKQTSERLFDFASALAGDDVDKMKEMQAAMEKGFKLATKAWGRDLPDISQKTLDAANKKFEEYYASKEKS